MILTSLFPTSAILSQGIIKKNHKSYTFTFYSTLLFLNYAWFGLQPFRMLAEVLVWKEMVILSGLKNGEGKITVAEMI